MSVLLLQVGEQFGALDQYRLVTFSFRSLKSPGRFLPLLAQQLS